ncbi:anti-sigma factor [Bradyrhizobium sp. LHD-71]|uniref:anti-sigma factor family protein n=1 Tax=Bradyrhizobium sp. LHD-71 TaxID=3072141 RepID=UPI00280FCBFC|nr:anti-sigma factor [Bradyrhizobium sp. LHD-71]MDQ8731999.1 anti-sigma factor [Bradyrhizobium sp. LHD-71]
MTMTEPNMPVTEDELHALVDNELPADRRAAVENWLKTHPDDAARVAAWRAMGNAMHARYGGVADEPVPTRLELERLATQPRRWMIGAAAAVLLAFAVGGGVGWFAREAAAAVATAPDPVDAMREEAFAAHRLYIGEVRHPIEVRAEENHLLPWLSRRIGMTLRAPDLSKFDLKLLGGRLLPGIGAPAALLMYENSAGERVTLYTTPLKAQRSSFRYQEADKFASIHWVADNYGWVVSGPADKPRLKSIAMAAIEQSERR